MSTLPRFETIPLPCSLAAASPMTDAEFEAMCLESDWIQYERTSDGAIRMNPPAGLLTGDGNAAIIHQLYGWWRLTSGAASSTPTPVSFSPTDPC